MKTSSLKSIKLIVFSIFCFCSPSFGGQDDSLYSVEIYGKIRTPNTEELKSYKIELLCHNVVIDSGTMVDDEPFLLRVKKNSLYTIRLTVPGHSPMVVSIDTRLSTPETEFHNYNFDGAYFTALNGFNLSLSLRNHLYGF